MRQPHKEHTYFWTKHPWKNPMRENWCNKYEGFIIMQISEYNYGAKSGSPNKE